MKTSITRALALFALLAPVGAWAQLSSSPIPDFTATALTGEKVSAAQLIGQPTILIVTPSTDAVFVNKDVAFIDYAALAIHGPSAHNSFGGFSQTSLAISQFRVGPDHRSGRAAFAAS